MELNGWDGASKGGNKHVHLGSQVMKLFAEKMYVGEWWCGVISLSPLSIFVFRYILKVAVEKAVIVCKFISKVFWSVAILASIF